MVIKLFVEPIRDEWLAAEGWAANGRADERGVDSRVFELGPQNFVLDRVQRHVASCHL